jgi:predicted transcriptional regulator with HTH domain
MAAWQIAKRPEQKVLELYKVIYNLSILTRKVLGAPSNVEGGFSSRSVNRQSGGVAGLPKDFRR